MVMDIYDFNFFSDLAIGFHWSGSLRTFRFVVGAGNKALLYFFVFFSSTFFSSAPKGKPCQDMGYDLLSIEVINSSAYPLGITNSR